MAYSLDFRKKVLEIKDREGLTLQQVSRRFSIGISSVVRWTQRLEPMLKRNKPATKINMEALKQDVLDYPDAYQHERAQRLGVSARGICDALKRLGVTYKKKPKTSQGLPRQTTFLSKKDSEL